MIEINGMAHVILTVSNFDKSREFYCELMPFLGLTKVYDGNNFVYHVGGRTAIGIQRCAPDHIGERFVQNRIGLHHLCLRARSAEDVDKVGEKLRNMGAMISLWTRASEISPKGVADSSSPSSSSSSPSSRIEGRERPFPSGSFCGKE